MEPETVIFSTARAPQKQRASISSHTRVRTINASDLEDDEVFDLQHASRIYADPKVLNYARNLRMSEGQKVDFVLVYELPEFGTKDFEAFRIALEAAESKSEVTPIKHYRKRTFFEARLQARGLVLEPELGTDLKTYYVKIHAPFNVLCKEAERSKMKMPLKSSNETVAKIRQSMIEDDMPSFQMFRQGSLHNRINDIMKNDLEIKDKTKYSYTEFRTEALELFASDEDEEAFFTDAQRGLLVWRLLDSTRFGKQPTNIGIGKLLEQSVYDAAFPLHDGVDEILYTDDKFADRHVLWASWARLAVWFKLQPLELIRSYYGEEIAMYFAWLGFYTQWLIAPALLGVIVVLIGVGITNEAQDIKDVCRSDLNMCARCDEVCPTWELKTICSSYKTGRVFDNQAIVAFGVIMSLWGSFFTDFWKRKNAELAYKWDVLDLNEDEPDRPQFKGTAKRPDPVTGLLVQTYPFKARLKQYVISGMSVMLMLCIVVIAVISIIVYRLAVSIALYRSSKTDSGISESDAGGITSFTAAVLNLIGIMVMGSLYNGLALRLNDLENHRKDSTYRAHLTFKRFLFAFVNSYSSIIYIAFFKGRFAGYPSRPVDTLGSGQDLCATYGCMFELTVQLVIIMVGNQTIGNFKEVFYPRLLAWLKSRTKLELPKEDVHRLPWVTEYRALDAFPALGIFDEYLEMVIQFGFVTLFVSAFPLAPLFALLNNIVEIRVDSNKLVTSYRRPPAFPAAGIGLWGRLLEVMSVLGVITNGCVIAFTSDFIQRLVYEHNHGSMNGYINSTYVLGSTNATSPYYCGFQTLLDRDSNNPEEFVEGQFYYQVYVAKLAFFILFEHVVFSLKACIEHLIPDIPKFVQLGIQRQHYMAKLALQGHLAHKEEQARDDDVSSVVEVLSRISGSPARPRTVPQQSQLTRV